jgi:hypothetical protein
LDVERWTLRPDALEKPVLLETMQPLAAVLDVSADVLVDNYIAALPTAIRVQETNPSMDEFWPVTMRHLRSTRFRGWTWFAPLAEAVAFTVVSKAATMKLEGNFSYLQAFTSDRQAGTGVPLARARLKVLLDGPPIDEFARKVECGLLTKYIPRSLCQESQNAFPLDSWCVCFVWGLGEIIKTKCCAHRLNAVGIFQTVRWERLQSQ